MSRRSLYLETDLDPMTTGEWPSTWRAAFTNHLFFGNDAYRHVHDCAEDESSFCHQLRTSLQSDMNWNYVCEKDGHELCLARLADGKWAIFDKCGCMMACSIDNTARHVVTIRDSLWYVRIGNDWIRASFHWYAIVPSGGVQHQRTIGTAEEPAVDLERDVGADYFIRFTPTKPIYYTWKDRVYCSASKSQRYGTTPCERYCSICDACFSANNFTFQHCRRHAVADRPNVRCVKQIEGVYLV